MKLALVVSTKSRARVELLTHFPTGASCSSTARLDLQTRGVRRGQTNKCEYLIFQIFNASSEAPFGQVSIRA